MSKETFIISDFSPTDLEEKTVQEISKRNHTHFSTKSWNIPRKILETGLSLLFAA